MKQQPPGAELSRRGAGRRVAGALMAALAGNAAPLAAQPPDELSAARETIRGNAGQLRKTKVPRDVEPSFRFEP